MSEGRVCASACVKDGEIQSVTHVILDVFKVFFSLDIKGFLFVNICKYVII